jgi:thioredoxin reductase (NADPH)
MTKLIADVAVIGAGAAGHMGALRAVLNNRNCIVFSGCGYARKRSRAMWVREVVNMPLMFGKKRAIMDATKETFDWIKNHEYFAQKFSEFKVSIKKVIKNDDDKCFTLIDGDGKEYYAYYVLLATGIMDLQPLIHGSIKPILPFANRGEIDYCIRCDGHKVIGKHAATIGATSTAAWVAVLLHEKYQPKSLKIFLNGDTAQWAGNEDLEKLIKLYNIEVVAEDIDQILTDDEGKIMDSIQLTNCEEKKVDIAFAMLGQMAYNELATGLGCEVTANGNVKANEKGETCVENFYVAGDLRDGGKYQIYTAWDQAVDSVDDMDRKIRANFRARALDNLSLKPAA